MSHRHYPALPVNLITPPFLVGRILPIVKRMPNMLAFFDKFPLSTSDSGAGFTTNCPQSLDVKAGF